jgi:hypothetical protein
MSGLEASINITKQACTMKLWTYSSPSIFKQSSPQTRLPGTKPARSKTIGADKNKT